jgi:hypothetical protein
MAMVEVRGECEREVMCGWLLKENEQARPFVPEAYSAHFTGVTGQLREVRAGGSSVLM